jgi:DNA (cytosine-5)-methyltransferase 1
MSGAYYNEIDPHAAQWLRNLISRGLIAPGEVDERSIQDIAPAELAGFTQCHFFAGIGVWSYAMRQAGVSDDTPIWTGSCPCQSFSAAGKGSGFDDERHLWPAWQWLIAQRRPRTIFGEQVSAAVRFGWLDLVFNDLEGLGYACGAMAIPACSVGAPHIRERLFFVADANSERRPINTLLRKGPEANIEAAGSRVAGELADANGCNASAEGKQRSGKLRKQPQDSGPGELGDAKRFSARGQPRTGIEAQGGVGVRSVSDDTGPSSAVVRPNPTNGYWANADWIGCTDGKWRPVEPGTFPLVDGSSFKLGSGSPYEGKSRAKMLRGYGNALVAPLAAEFIRAYMDARSIP